MLRMVTGHAQAPDAADAAREAVMACREGLGGDVPGVGILYTSYMDADFARLLDVVAGTFGDMPLLGCTTDGEFSSSLGFAEESLLLGVLSAERLRFGVGLGGPLAGDPRGAAGRALDMARQALGCAPACCIPLPDGLAAFTNPVAEPLAAELGAGVPVVGGSAGDGFRITGTFQFLNGEVHTDTLPVLLIGGPLKCSFGAASGWTPVGPEHVVTAAEGPVAARIGERTALDFYRDHLGREDLELADITAFNLAVLEDGGHFHLRAPARLFPESGGIAFAGGVAPGARVRLTRMSSDDISQAARVSAATAAERYPGDAPEAVLAFSCTSRRQILGSRTGEEVEHLREVFGADVPFCGFATYGEICPQAPGAQARFHNGAFVTLCLGEG